MTRESWQVTYPRGLVKHIDYFRYKYFQYDIFDEVLRKYIEKYVQSPGRRLCSLGAGTGRHEVELAKKGFIVLGIEQNQESLNMARDYVFHSGVEVDLIKCDFLKSEELDEKLVRRSPFDVVVLLFVPISIGDYRKAIMNMAKYIVPGGCFITDLFGYAEPVDPERLVITSDVEVADSPNKDDYAVRLNYYEYHKNIINWDAIYLFFDENKQLCMACNHNILEVTPEEAGVDPQNLDAGTFELLPTYRITETHDCINPPYLYNYLIGWRKKC